MIVTVYTVEEANEKAKEGYELVSVNKMSEYEWDGTGGYQARQDYLTYTLQCTFMNKLSKAAKES